VTARGPTEAGANPPPTTAPAEADDSGASSTATDGTTTAGVTRVAGRSPLGAGALGQVRKATAVPDANKIMKKRNGMGNVLLRYNQKKFLQASAQKRAGVQRRPPFQGTERRSLKR